MVQAVISQSVSAQTVRVKARQSQGHDFAEILDVLRRRRVMIIFTALLFFGGAVLYSLFATVFYTTTAQIIIDPREKRLMESSISPRDFTSETGVAMVENQMRILISEDLLLKVINHLKLSQDKEFGGKAKSSFEGLRSIALTLGLISDGNSEQKALKILQKNVSVKRADRAFVVDLKVTSQNPQKSAQIANTILEFYQKNVVTNHIEQTKKATTSLTSRLTELKEAVRKAEEKSEIYKQSKGIVGAGGKLISEQQLQEINNQMVMARARVSELRARIEQLQRFQRNGGDISAIAEVVQSTTVSALRQQINEVTRQEADLLTTLGAKHPQVQSVQRQLLDLRKLLNEDIQRVARSLTADYERAIDNEKALSQTVDGLKKESLSTGSDFVQLRELEREVEAARTVYNAYLNRAKETGEQEQIDPSNVRVISQALVPHEKSWPPTSILLPLALALGFGVGAGLAIFKEAGDDRLHSKRQVEKIAGVSVIGSLPALSRFGQDKWLTAVIDKPNSKFSKQAKRIFATSGVSSQGASKHSVLLLSDQPNSARSMLAMNMALIAATQGLRVLLIDADLTTRTLSKWAADSNTPGIFDIANGSLSLNQAMLHDKRTGVYLLPASGSKAKGKSGVNVSVLQNIMNDAKMFHLIIIDGGAVTNDSLGVASAQLMDNILLSIEYGKTRQNNLAETMVALGQAAGNLKGVVMSNAPANLA